LESAFVDWVENACIFTSTLVDRIVTGYPRDEAKDLCEEFGYTDNAIDTSEIFHTWVIEGPSELANELPFDKCGLHVIFTPDVKPYKKRKVRILNGAHTCSVLGAYLAGKTLVGEMMKDERYYDYLTKALNNEVMPALTDLEYDDLKSFSDAVFDRFQNPYIKHKLLDISLNSTAKFKARVLPTIKEYYEIKKELPKILTFSFAAYLAFFNGTEIRDGALIGHRELDGEYLIKDDAAVLETYAQLHKKYDIKDKQQCAAFVKEVCSNTTFWGEDLTKFANFADVVTENLYGIATDGIIAQTDKVLA
jgi:tagaturonate reductase